MSQQEQDIDQWTKKKDVQQIIYKGQKIEIEHYQSVLQQKMEHYRWHGGTPQGKHLHDFHRAGVEPKM